MTTITGTIENIERVIAKGVEKTVVTISSDNQYVPYHIERTFIEFRGYISKEIEIYKVGDMVQCVVYFEGKISKSSGVKYNNLVAQSIERIIKNR